MDECSSKSLLNGEIENISDSSPKPSDVPPSPSPHKAVSKNQLRRMAKREKWKDGTLAKRQLYRERRKVRIRESKQAGIDTGPTRKSLKRHRMAASSCPLRLAVDCSFDSLMMYKDIIKLVKQVQHCYAINRRREDNMVQMYVTSYGGQMQERYEAIDGAENWDIHLKSESYSTLFPKAECVYLTSESSNLLSEVTADKVYIIGGLVDHNSEKGLCYKLAGEMGISHARLPIDKYIDMKTRKVLTVDHVFEILARVYDTKDWANSLSAVLPKRKDAVVKETETSETVEGEEVNDTKVANDIEPTEVEKAQPIVDLEIQELANDTTGVLPILAGSTALGEHVEQGEGDCTTAQSEVVS